MLLLKTVKKRCISRDFQWNSYQTLAWTCTAYKFLFKSNSVLCETFKNLLVELVESQIKPVLTGAVLQKDLADCLYCPTAQPDLYKHGSSG